MRRAEKPSSWPLQAFWAVSVAAACAGQFVPHRRQLGLRLQQFHGLRRGRVAQDEDAAVGVELQAPRGDPLGERRRVDHAAQREGGVRVDAQAVRDHVVAGRAAARLLEDGALGAGLELGELGDLAAEDQQAGPGAELLLDERAAAVGEEVASGAAGEAEHGADGERRAEGDVAGEAAEADRRGDFLLVVGEGQHALDLREGVDVGRVGQAVEQEPATDVRVEARGRDLLLGLVGDRLRPLQLERAAELEVFGKRRPVFGAFGLAGRVRGERPFGDHRRDLRLGEGAAGFVADEE